MPGLRCAVFGCNNSRVSTKISHPEIVYHNFPKESDFVSKTIKSEWIRRCKRADKWNPNTSSVCSVHFTENDYERDMRNELLGLPVRKHLKKTAVPCLNLPQTSKNIKQNSAREIRYLKNKEKIQRKEEVSKLIAQEGIPSTSTADPNYERSMASESTSVNSIYIDAPVTTEDLPHKYTKLLGNYAQLKQEVEVMKRKLNLQRKQITYYKKKSKYTKPAPKTDAMNILKKILTENQIAILTNKKKRVNWTTDEIAVAFTIRYFSKKCYVYLRTKLNFPLPALSTLRSWASKIRVKPGILKDVLTFLKVAGENMSDKEKIIVISFDEVKIKSTLEYDVGEDQVLGRYNLMQVCMIRSLFSTWKQPVYIGFDQKMTRDVLMDIITQTHNISYNCVAIVSDCGSSNVGLWKELSVDMNKPYFAHPQTEKHIYVFADAPHLLKLLRNWLLDTGFTFTNDGTKIRKEPLKSLIQLTNTEVNSCYKISDQHITVEKSRRQNVRLAAELLSHNTAQALLRYKPGPDKKLAEDLGAFIDDINSWFDIFNSHVNISPHPSPMKAPFGIYLKEQEEHLDKFKKSIYNMKAEGKKSLQIFQKGIIMSIESLKLLFRDITTDFQDIHYLCTHKLNQDCLENFFFQLRCRGPNEHPSPLEAMKRMRMIILGKNPGILEAQVNTQETVPEEYMVAKVLEQTKVSVELSEEETKSIATPNSSGSSFSSSGVSDTSLELNAAETTEDAFEYIAGYIAKKFKSSHPHLGDFTYKMKSDHTYRLPSWVQQLSFGGLIKPSTDFLTKVKRWNKYFELYHANEVRKHPLVVLKLAIKIKKRDDMTLDVIKLFCKLRTIIRINYLNTKNTLDSSRKSKRKSTTIIQSTDAKRKLTKKMRKTIS